MSVRVACDVCNIPFKFTKQGLKRHQMYTHDERNPCSDCKQLFSVKGLRIHQKVRDGCTKPPTPHQEKVQKKKQKFYVQWGNGPIKKAPANFVKLMQSGRDEPFHSKHVRLIPADQVALQLFEQNPTE